VHTLLARPVEISPQAFTSPLGEQFKATTTRTALEESSRSPEDDVVDRVMMILLQAILTE
jgi:hypothetical protein